MSAISRILIPLDIHHLSEAKIPVAEAQARAFGAELILLHVYPPDHVAADAVSSAEAQAHTYLDAIAARMHADGISARSLVRAGRPVETILAEITAQSADLVVLGSTIHHGLSRLLLGSVAEEIIARAPCPVLLVRPPSGMGVIRPPAVRSFAEDAARTGPLSQRDLGLRTVEVARIIGSVGRTADLDENFHSRHPQRMEMQRYKRIFTLMSEGAALPAIVLYKLGYGYYVLDGHHRVAAAKQLGQLEMEAHVTEYVPLGDPPDAASHRRTPCLRARDGPAPHRRYAGWHLSAPGGDDPLHSPTNTICSTSTRLRNAGKLLSIALARPASAVAA